MHKVAAIILAAGKGTRMKSTTTNKVVSPLAKKPIISYTVENLKRSDITTIIAVVGFAQDSVKKALGSGVIYANQKNPQGTGHALKAGLKKVSPDIKLVLSMYGDDSAFCPPPLIKKLIAEHQNNQAVVTLITVEKDDPTGLGRIIRAKSGEFLAIVEEKNATPTQKKIKEINTGFYCFDREFLDANIGKIKKNSISGEYYLTDIIEIAKSQGKKAVAILWPDNSIYFGVNTPDQLIQANQLMSQSLRQ